MRASRANTFVYLYSLSLSEKGAGEKEKTAYGAASVALYKNQTNGKSFRKPPTTGKLGFLSPTFSDREVVFTAAAMDSHVQYGGTGTSWTNEKHVHFLNSMEASFVRSMFQNRTHCHHHHHLLRLDRHLPDTSDSTVDSKPPPQNNRKNHATSGGGRIDGRASRRSRRRTSRPYNSSQDQVVPQMEKRAGGDEDEKDHAMSSVN